MREPPGKSDAIFFDDDVPGLGLRLRGGGKRSWIFQYGIGAKQRRMTLGTAPALTLAAARKTATELYAHVRLGEDPAASKREGQRRAADTVEAILRLYLPEKRRTLAPRSCVELERHLLRYAKPLHGLGAALVSRRDIGNLLAAIAASSGSPTANTVRASLSAFFAWCMARGLLEQNPVTGTHVAPMHPRTRVLSLAELSAVWRACEDNVYGAIVKLLILTGQRRDEIGGLRFGEICEGIIALPASRAKNKRAHAISLSPRRRPSLPGGRRRATSSSAPRHTRPGPGASACLMPRSPRAAKRSSPGRCTICAAALPPAWPNSASRRISSRRS